MGRSREITDGPLLRDEVRHAALPLRSPADLDPVLERIGRARLVLIGEASHGTSEFYRWRAELTKRLVAEKGFAFVAVEGDWPDCYTVHCSVTAGRGSAPPREALLRFDRWPRWMWANEEVLEFATWLRAYNDARPPPQRVGFHGLDVYSLFASLRAVLDYLAEHEPEHVPVAHEALRCFEPYGEDPQSYALAGRMVPTGCEDAVVSLLRRLLQPGGRSVGAAGAVDARFVAEQNARAAADAERYYRAMIRAGAEAWNLRDCHMADTLDRLLERYGAGDDTPAAKAVVWEHNTHVGDARATDMAGAGMLNVGQLARERHGRDHVVLVGFGTHRGSVIASPRWGGPVRRMRVPPARPGSLEDLLHDAAVGDAAFVLTGGAWSGAVRDHRAIGVVYRPEVERRGNYVPTVLDERYDAFLFCDETAALRPLHPVEHADAEPGTYPTGE